MIWMSKLLFSIFRTTWKALKIKVNKICIVEGITLLKDVRRTVLKL